MDKKSKNILNIFFEKKIIPIYLKHYKFLFVFNFYNIYTLEDKKRFYLLFLCQKLDNIQLFYIKIIIT